MKTEFPSLSYEDLIEACLKYDSRKTRGAARLIRDIYVAANAMLRGLQYSEAAKLLYQHKYHQEMANADASVYRAMAKADAVLEDILADRSKDPIGLIGHPMEDELRDLYSVRRPRRKTWSRKRRAVHEAKKRKKS